LVLVLNTSTQILGENTAAHACSAAQLIDVFLLDPMAGKAFVDS
jgi:hypothetical protein